MEKKKSLILLAVATAIVGFVSCSSKKVISSADNLTPEIYNLASKVDSVSYIIGKANGYQLIKQTKTQMDSWPIKGNYDAFMAGLNEAVKDPDDDFFLGENIESITGFVNSFFQTMAEKAAEENKEKGETFLAENKTKSGVITTESGLQYKIITEGTGEKPNAENEVKVHYQGKLVDGTIFDSSYERGEPVTFPLGNVIRGWVEGLQLMPVGSKFIFWIPAELGYGIKPPSQTIPPNSMLEFEIELLEIAK